MIRREPLHGEALLREWLNGKVLVAPRPEQQVRILRIALEAIYGTPELTLAEARALAHQALEDTD